MKSTLTTILVIEIVVALLSVFVSKSENLALVAFILAGVVGIVGLILAIRSLLKGVTILGILVTALSLILIAWTALVGYLAQGWMI